MTISEKALSMHEKWNGKLETISKTPVKSREDLAIAYTPGVAEPCRKIAENKEDAYRYTMKANTVAVISDGSAVLGLGNIGPHAAMPVMEGKAVLFKDSAASMPFLSVWTHRTPKRSSKRSPGLRPASAVSTWKISVHPGVLK